MQTKPTEVTQEHIDAWKAKHGEIFLITVEDKKGYFKKPDRKTLSYASTVATKDPLQFNEIILNGCFLGGDEELIKNDDYFFATSSKIEGLIQIKNADLVKL